MVLPLKRNSVPTNSLKTPITPRKRPSTLRSRSLGSLKKANHSNNHFTDEINHFLNNSYDNSDSHNINEVIPPDISIEYKSDTSTPILNFQPIYKLGEGDYFTVYLICRNVKRRYDLNMNFNDFIRSTHCNNTNSNRTNSNFTANFNYNYNYLNDKNVLNTNSNSFICKKCVNLNPKFHTALKVSKTRFRPSDLREVRILADLANVQFDSENNSIGRNSQRDSVLQLKSAFTFHETLFIETDYCDGETLADLINHVYVTEKGQFTDEVIDFIMLRLLDGLEVLKRKNVLHCDICPRNLFIKRINKKKYDSKNRNYNKSDDRNTKERDKDGFNSKNSFIRSYRANLRKESERSIGDENDLNTFDYDFDIVFGDFNISIYSHDSLETEGTMKYLPIEVLSGEYNFGSDLFAVMLIWLELKEGIELPGTGEMWHRLRNGDLELTNFDKQEKRLMKRAFTKNRPTIQEIRDVILSKKDFNK